MSNFPHKPDYESMDYYVRRAHAERADALAHAIATAGRQIKSLFSSPDAETGGSTCGSNA